MTLGAEKEKLAESTFPESVNSTSVDALQRRRPRVCLVTAEFHGLFKNGGIGTANTGLALELARAEFDVVVAFVDTDPANQSRPTFDFAELRIHYQHRGLTLELVPRHPLLRSRLDDHLAASYSVYGYLAARDFDVVFFNECGGQGFYSLLAKRAGLFPKPPRMCVVAHGSLAWVLEINGQLCWGVRPIAVNFVERRSVELADTLIAPSRYLIDWMISRGWALPKNVEMIQNIMPTSADPVESGRVQTTAAVSELVFFGRLEARKGLELFCDAIDRLGEIQDLSGIGLTFMGKFSRIGGLHSGVYIIERSRNWKSAPRIITHYDQAEALAYLRRPGALAVIPSLAENSPCVVAECLIADIPFVATNTGGTPELLASEDRELCLFPPTPEALCAKLGEVLDKGVHRGRIAVAQVDTAARWRELAASVCGEEAALERAEAPAELPRVSICLVHEAGCEPRVLDSAAAQIYHDLEIVSVAYGADPLTAAKRQDDKFQNSPNIHRFSESSGDRGAARNAAAARATGEYLVFVNERDVVLRPNCVAVFVAVAIRCSADIVTGVPLEFDQSRDPIEGWDGEINYFPVGADKELAAFENCLGHSVILISHRKLTQIGGFDVAVNAEIEDWLLLTRAVLAGAKLEVAATPQFWLRGSRSWASEVHERVEDQRRILRAYAAEKIEIVGRAMESVIVAAPQTRSRVLRALDGLGATAKEIASDLSFSPLQTGPEALKLFLEYCVARGRFREACDFAGLADPVSLLPIAQNAAKTFAERAALSAVKDVRRRDIVHSVALTAIIAERIRPVSGPRTLLLTRAPGIAASHPVSPGQTILKALASVPPGARSVEAIVGVEGSERSEAQLALAVCEPGAELNFSGRDLSPRAGIWWSGWTRAAAGGAPTRIRTSLEGFVGQPLDIFFLSRSDGDIAKNERINWQDVNADVSVLELAVPSTIERNVAASTVPRHLIERAELLTPAPDFPVPFFTPGDPIMHHPLIGRAAVARIGRAIFPGAIGVRAVFSIQNEKAHAIDFAFWVRPPSDPATDESMLAGSVGWSGWRTIRVPFQQHQATLTLPAPAEESLDLYLATKVVEAADVNWCHAAWHDIAVLEPVVPLR